MLTSNAVPVTSRASDTVPARIGTQTDILGESPLWDERAQCLYWVDIRRPALRRYRPADGRVDTWPLPDLAGSIALTDDNRLLVALPQQIVVFDPASAALEPFVSPPDHRAGHRFNDGRCDNRGRFWVGTMHNLTRAAEGVLYRLEGRGPMVAVRQGVCIPNSLAFSPDGTRMYFADSLQHTIYQHDYDPVTGEPGAPQPFFRSAPPAFPDGSAVDEAGYVWNAEFHGARLVRISPSGEIDRVVEMPVKRPTCCAFGGADFRTLYVTSTSQNMSEADRAADPLAGALFALRVDVRGLPERRFAMSGQLERSDEHA